MENKKNILEICNQLWIWWTEKTLQIFCKYLDKTKYNIFACWIFNWWHRELIIKNLVSNILIANWDIEKIKNFVIQNNINIVHWHSISQNSWEQFYKSIELLKFFKNKNIKIIETSPFSLYNEKIDDLLDFKLFVSKTNLIKYFWKFGKKLRNKLKYSYLYNPLDIEELEKLRLSLEQKKELRKQYWILENDFVIWKVGRANLWKWDDTIINIINDLLKEIKNLKVVIRAIPEIKKKKIKKMWLEKYFIFLPESVIEKDITDTYQLMDIMLHTSRIWECNSVAINEWMFFWLPIITKPTNFLDKTIFDRDNWQIEIIENWKNWFYSDSDFIIIKKIIDLYKNKKLLSNISNTNKEKVYKLFNQIDIIKKLEWFFVWNNYFNFDFNNEILKYKIQNVKSSKFKLIKINLLAIYDKFFNKA